MTQEALGMVETRTCYADRNRCTGIPQDVSTEKD